MALLCLRRIIPRKALFVIPKRKCAKRKSRHTAYIRHVLSMYAHQPIAVYERYTWAERERERRPGGNVIVLTKSMKFIRR